MQSATTLSSTSVYSLCVQAVFFLGDRSLGAFCLTLLRPRTSTLTMKLTRIKNLLPSNKKRTTEDSVSPSSSLDRISSRTPSQRKLHAEAAQRQQEVSPTVGAASLEPSMDGLTPEEKRQVFSLKLRCLSQTLIGDSAVVIETEPCDVHAPASGGLAADEDSQPNPNRHADPSAPARASTKGSPSSVRDESSTVEEESQGVAETQSRWEDSYHRTGDHNYSYDEHYSLQKAVSYCWNEDEAKTVASRTLSYADWTQATNYTEVTHDPAYTSRFWYRLFTGCSDWGVHDPDGDDEDGEEDDQPADERPPLNPCTAPTCVVPRESPLARFLSMDEDDRSQFSRRETRFAADDARQTSFASGSRSSNSSRSPQALSPYSSGRKQLQAFFNQGATPKTNNKKANLVMLPVTSKAVKKKSTADKPTTRSGIRQIEFITGDYAGKRQAIPMTTPVRTEPLSGFGGFWGRNRNSSRYNDEYDQDDDYDDDDSTLSTKFSFMATRN